MDIFDKLKNAILAAEEDAEKFEKGNKAAGVRLRKAMQDTKVLAQQVRQYVTDVKTA